MSLARRAARALWREAILRKRPHGLMSLAYLRRRPPALAALHRALWLDGLPGWPRAALLCIDAWLWCRWTLVGAPVQSWRAVRRHGDALARETRLSRPRQAMRVLGLAWGWTIPPGQAYQYGLVATPTAGNDGVSEPLAWIYGPETGAWHRHLNGPGPEAAAAVALLQDKLRLTRHLEAAGIPMAPILACVARDDPADLLPRLDGPGMPPAAFCKQRDGMRGQGAFAAWREDGRWRARAEDGTTAQGTAPIESLWQSLRARGDVLIQPRLANHPATAPLVEDGGVVTVRLITRTDVGEVGVFLALLEVPVRGQGHRMCPIDADSGLATVSPDGPALQVPDWPSMVAHSRHAHRLVGALRTIAWDWIVTPDGPRLLEGNSSWRVGPAQRFAGPLATAFPRS